MKKTSTLMKPKPLAGIAGRLSPGLTLLEILITIAILMIVTAVAYPSFQRLAINNYLKTATRDLAADIAALKERSLAEYRIHRLVINVGNGSYTMDECTNTGAVCNGWNQIGQKSLVNTANGLAFTGATNTTTLRFEPRGTLNPADIGTIVIGNQLNSTGTLTLNITGRSRVQFNLQ